MSDWLIRALRCVFCGGGLSLTDEIETRPGAIGYGLLCCSSCASVFPVVEGIPILLAAESTCNTYTETQDEVVLRGARVESVIEAIRNRDSTAALGLLLNPYGLDGPGWTLPLPHRHQRTYSAGPRMQGDGPKSPVFPKPALLRPARDLYRSARKSYRRLVLPEWRRRLAEYLLRDRDELWAQDVIDLYYRAYSGHADIGNYFMYRFGQPRHLATLHVAQLMRSSKGPLLDVACGAGHLTHFLSYGREGAPVVGIDRDFFRLLLAKRFIAPQGEFVCAAADASLPFADGIFDFVLCSDAFHLFRSKVPCVREFQRTLSPSGTIILSRVGNRQVKPNEGYELDVGGYRRLLGGLPSVVLSEEALRLRYLRNEGVDLSLEREDPEVRCAKWLTFVATRRKDILMPHPPFDAWPHGVGRLGINPIFAPDGKAEGGEKFRFAFPSSWYEFEDAEYRDYAPATCVVSQDVLNALAEGRRTPAMEEHVKRFEILGMPDRFIRPAADQARQ